MKILLTGATGFIGSAILKELLKREFDIRVMVRNRKNFSGSNLKTIEVAEGDIANRGQVMDAVKGCSRIIHTAGLYSLWSLDRKEIYETNVQGTINILEAALSQGVERVVYTSSISTIAPPAKNRLADENSRWRPGDIKYDYVKTKYLAEGAVAKYYNKYGLPAVILNPGIVIGEGDSRPTPSGEIIINFIKGKIPVFFNGGGNFVDVEDIAKWHVSALSKGLPGERYILGTENLTFLDFLKIVAKYSNRAVPAIKVPASMAFAFARASEFLSRHLTKTPPVFTKEGVEVIRKGIYCDCRKAHQEFGGPETPIETSVNSAIKWYRDNNYLR